MNNGKVQNGALDVPQEELSITGKSISDDELEMITEIRMQANEQEVALSATRNVLGKLLQKLGQKYKISEREVIGPDGKIMEISEEAFQKLRMTLGKG